MSLSLTGEDLTLEAVAAIANGEGPMDLHPDALRRVNASRQVVEDVLAAGKTVYGVNTGFGAMSNTVIPHESLAQLQLNLVRSHAVGTGPLLDTATVRAMMLLRANTLAKGVSGVRPVVIDTLLALLRHGIHPVIPSQGSLGASGDLAPLAHLALVLIGEGEAFYQEDRLPGGEALSQAGIPPLVLAAKEGLALLNGTQMMTALGILTLLEAERLMDLAEVAGAMTVEAVRGSHAPFDARVSAARPHPGQIRSATILRQVLAGSEIAPAHEDCPKVQDPYSLRCIPQVHGAIRQTLSAVRDTLTLEANAATDNPLVFPNGDILSQGNFHGEPVAMALDHLAIALTELSSLSERRMDKLMNPVFSDLPTFLIQHPQPGLNSGFMIVHYTAASLVSENKILSHPACVDSIPTSNDKEDHVSMGATAARKAQRVLEHARWVIAAELLAAAQGLEFQAPLKPGHGVQAVYAAIRQVVPPLTTDRSMAGDVEAVMTLMQDGTLWGILEPYVSPSPD